MFISKKKFNALEKRIADLEVQIQSQQNRITITGGCIEGKMVLNASDISSKIELIKQAYD